MAYETGASTGANDLLDKLRIFAIAQGWTANRWVTAGLGRELCLSKGTAFYNMRSWQNEEIFNNGAIHYTLAHGISLNGSDSYSGAAAWDRQPGYPVMLAAGVPAEDQWTSYLPFVLNSGPFPAYHMFAPDSKTIYLEVEVTTGKFHRMGFGSLDLFSPTAAGGGRFFYSTAGTAGVTKDVGGGTWLGSDIDASSLSQEEVPFRIADINGYAQLSASAVRAAFGGAFDNWCGSAGLTASSPLGRACQGGGVHDKVLRDASPNPLNGVGILTPNVVSLNQADQYLLPVGVVPGMRYMDMTNYLPGDEFSLGPDVYKVFPWFQKGGRSHERGIAYKKVA